ncbi:cyclic nucleotide-binding protein [Chitinophagaceae bacterium IBVUCB1]|nr:cyclic nucleotide-binding protein [Chitinophagaceae bacterium IBVUCB1]
MQTEVRKKLLTFLSTFDAFTNQEIEEIADKLNAKKYLKGTMLIREGEVCKECYFVLKGCLRQYHIDDGIEITTQFYTEEQAAVLFSSYVNGTAADTNLICNEDSILIVGNLEDESEMYNRYPKLLQVTRQMMEQSFGKIQNDYAKFIASSAEERYLNLLETRPSLLQRAPLNQIASYLGITPESLSRIRKRIVR